MCNKLFEFCFVCSKAGFNDSYISILKKFPCLIRSTIGTWSITCENSATLRLDFTDYIIQFFINCSTLSRLNLYFDISSRIFDFYFFGENEDSIFSIVFTCYWIFNIFFALSFLVRKTSSFIVLLYYSFLFNLLFSGFGLENSFNFDWFGVIKYYAFFIIWERSSLFIFSII